MYEELENLDSKTFYQGDIVSEFPFLILSGTFALLEEIDTETYKVSRSKSIPTIPRENALANRVRLTKVVILSQTCDIQNNSNVMVAPIYSVSQVLADGRLKDDHVKLLRKRRNAMKDWFYLPETKGLEEAFVDFQTMHYFPRTSLDAYLPNRVVSMNDWGRHLLGWALMDYFGRPIEDKYRK